MARRAPALSYRRRFLSGSRPLRIVCVAIVLVLIVFVPAEAQRAPDFTLKDLSGRAWSLSGSFPDKVVLLDFWATWCVPCIKELPHLQRLQDLYGGKGLQVLTISTDGPDRVAGVSAFVARYGFSFPVLLDTESRVVSVYNPSLVLPYSVLVDRGGVIRYVHQGYSPGDERLLEERILALLEESEPKPKPRTSVRVNDSFLLRLPKKGSERTDSESAYSEALNQLDVTLSNGGLLAGVRLDANLDLSPFDPDARVAKRYVQYVTKHFQARAGDFYTSLGRGLVFSLVKVFEEEGLDYVVDTTVDGGQASVATGPFSGDVFGGWIDRPVDSSVHDKVVGFAVGSSWPGVATVRVQGVGAELQPGGEFRNHRVETGSVSLELPELAGAVAVYGEFSLMRRRTYKAEAPIDGHGLYVASKLHAGRFSLLFEVKDYKELNFEFSHPPLLESEELDLLADQFDLDRTD
ncbi:MAG: alkyl hydroperoxide reductase/Thiol specific antioxidant/Mal allergen, partial [Bacteroidetes bacterium]|nr:alkyl hydroperoxide reductase/Thiol specific antioxidant/Mal allergen [Bacteroidota bacterium]